MSGLRTALVIAAALTAATLTGCTSTSGSGSGSGSSTPPPSVGPSSGPTAVTTSTSPPARSGPTTTVTVTAPPAPTKATSTAASVKACTAAQLTVAGGPLPGGSAAGHVGVLLSFHNASSRACTLYGYPGVAGLNSSGAQIAQAKRTLNGYLAGCRCSSLHTVTLKPGAIASATTEGSVGTGDCDTFSALLVTPPNTATSTKIDLVPHSCDFTIHPVVLGSTGSG